jgi:hypothetical protein
LEEKDDSKASEMDSSFIVAGACDFIESDDDSSVKEDGVYCSF